MKWFKSIGKYLMILSCGTNFLEYVQAEKFWTVIFIIGIVFFFCGEYLVDNITDS